MIFGSSLISNQRNHSKSSRRNKGPDSSPDKPLKDVTVARVLCDVCDIHEFVKDFDEQLSSFLKIVLNHEKSHYNEYVMTNDDFLFMKEVEEKLMEKVLARTFRGPKIGSVLKVHEDILKLQDQWTSHVKQAQNDNQFTESLHSKFEIKRSRLSLSERSESDIEGAQSNDTGSGSSPESQKCTNNAGKLTKNKEQQKPTVKKCALTKDSKTGPHEGSPLDVTDHNEVPMDLHDTYQEEKLYDPNEVLKENSRNGGAQLQTEQCNQNVCLATGKKYLSEQHKDEFKNQHAGNEHNDEQRIEMRDQPASVSFQAESPEFDDEWSEDQMSDVESYLSFLDVNLTFLSDSGKINSISDLNNNLQHILSGFLKNSRNDLDESLEELDENCEETRLEFCPNVEFWKNIEY